LTARYGRICALLANWRAGIAIFQVQRAEQPQAAPQRDQRPEAGPLPLSLIAPSVWTWPGILV